MNISETRIEYLMDIGKAHVYVKRDDLIPFSFGGNKVRIAAEVFREMEKRGCDTVISYGSISSNLNRVMAHMAKVSGKKCIIIIKKEPGEEEKTTFNERMVRESGAEIVLTDPMHVRDTVASVLASSRARGEHPYYIYGDETGKGGEEVLKRAYREVFSEITRQEETLGIRFPKIYVPVGTGATYGGLKDAADPSHKIFGISVARTHEDDPFINDSFLMGGYGKYTKELAEFLRTMRTEHALMLDPVYTGKAFYGMTKELKAEEEEQNVLFIHTGGTPLFFDFLQKEEDIDEV